MFTVRHDGFLLFECSGTAFFVWAGAAVCGLITRSAAAANQQPDCQHKKNRQTDPLGCGKRSPDAPDPVSPEKFVQKADHGIGGQIDLQQVSPDLLLQPAIRPIQDQVDSREKQKQQSGFQKLHRESCHNFALRNMRRMIEDAKPGGNTKAAAAEKAADAAESVEQRHKHGDDIAVQIHPVAFAPDPPPAGGQPAEESAVKDRASKELKQTPFSDKAEIRDGVKKMPSDQHAHRRDAERLYHIEGMLAVLCRLVLREPSSKKYPHQGKQSVGGDFSS